MKNFEKLIFIFITLLTISCKSQTSVIGKIQDGIPIITIDEERMLNNWQNNLKTTSKINATFNSVAILEIDGNYYLRATGNEFVSTVLLKYDRTENSFVAEGITCTSQTCSTTNGCIPDGKTKCTGCTLNDCTKTVSSVTIISRDLE